VLQTGGHLLAAKLSKKELDEKSAVVVSGTAHMQRADIDIKLVQQS